jgi:hypothetical protein
MTIPVLGAIVRYKAQILPFLIIFLISVVGNEALKNQKISTFLFRVRH